MASSVTAPLERQFGQVPGLEPDDVDEFGWQLGDHAAVRAGSEHRCGGAGGAGGDQLRRSTYLPTDLPNPPIYSKVNPADAPILTLALTSDSLPLVEGGGPGGHCAGAEDLAAAGRGAGVDQRRTEAGSADPGESDGAGVVWVEPGRHAGGGGARRMWTRRRADLTGRGSRTRSARTIRCSPASSTNRS